MEKQHKYDERIDKVIVIYRYKYWQIIQFYSNSKLQWLQKGTNLAVFKADITFSKNFCKCIHTL